MRRIDPGRTKPCPGSAGLPGQPPPHPQAAAPHPIPSTTRPPQFCRSCLTGVPPVVAVLQVPLCRATQAVVPVHLLPPAQRRQPGVEGEAPAGRG